MPIVAYSANRTGHELLSDVGVNLLGRRRITKKIDVTVADPVERDGALMLKMTWRTVDPRVWCAVLNGKIEVAGLGDGQTHLALDGTCEPPLGVAGGLIARTLLRRVADASVQDFVERVRGRLESD